jgi:hypothetical protein
MSGALCSPICSLYSISPTPQAITVRFVSCRVARRRETGRLWSSSTAANSHFSFFLSFHLFVCFLFFPFLPSLCPFPFFSFGLLCALTGLPLAANIAHTALLRARTGDGAANIYSAVYPMPFTANQQVLITAANGFSIAIITVIAFVFIPASYAVFVVRERENKAKHIQTISGVSQTAYWVSTYAWVSAVFVLALVPCF